VPGRRAYIDWARGLAVLIMIEAHALDAWTRTADRSSLGYRNLTILGGFAAPLFLWLAGVSLVLSVESRLRRSGNRRQAMIAAVRRGVGIFALAFAFRLQAFLITPGSSPVSLLRVDVLNVMGPAMVLAAVAWGTSRSRLQAAWTCAGAAVATALLTPLVRSAVWIDSIPAWLQWYLRPAGQHTTFTLLPWAGFIFAGAAAGVIMAAASDRQAESRTLYLFGAFSVLLIVGGLYAASRPSIFPSSSFWTSSPAYFAIRVGIVTLVPVVLWALSPVSSRWRSPFAVLSQFGRHSLLIYWIHVELVYGYTTWLIHGRLPLPGTVAAYAAFSAVMYAVTVASDRITWTRRPVHTTGAPRVIAQR
jgi:uncharacterized membrane protein